MEFVALAVLWLIALVAGESALTTSMIFLALAALVAMQRRSRSSEQVKDLQAQIWRLHGQIADLRDEIQRPAASSLAPMRASQPARTDAQVTPAAPIAVNPPTESAPEPSEVTSQYEAAYVPEAVPFFKNASAESLPSRRSLPDIEEMLGTNWLSKIGISLLVVGIVSFLATQWGRIPAWGKDGLLVAAGAALLAGGVWFEKRERYRVLGHTLVGGGWALLYFTAYAVQHVAAMRLVEAELVGLVLMGVVAGAMIAFTLRYRSEAATGTAYALAFTTILIGHRDVYTLTVNALLLASLAYLVLRFRWWVLEIGGIVAIYGAHWNWLRPIIEARAPHSEFAQYPISTVLLVAYWAIFRTTYLLRKSLTKNEEFISTAACILNPLLLMAVMKYQSLHPEYAFYALLGLGAIEFALARLPFLRARRIAVVNLTVIGTLLMLVAIPFKYSGMELSLVWLAGGEALLIAGVFAHERLFVRLAGLVHAVVAGYVLCLQAFPFTATHMGAAHFDLRIGLPLLALGVVTYANQAMKYRLRPTEMEGDAERIAMLAFSLIAGLSLALAAWVLLPSDWVGFAWAAEMMALAVASRGSVPELRMQAMAIGGAAALRCCWVNIATEPQGWRWSLLPVLLAMPLFYVSARWVRDLKRALTAPGTLLCLLLIWQATERVWVAPAWAGVGLALLEIGAALAIPMLEWQAYVVFAAVLVRCGVVNVHGPLRIATMLPVTGLLLYGWWRQRSVEVKSPWAWVLTPALAAAAVAVAMLLVLYEAPDRFVEVWWAVACGCVLAGAMLLRDRSVMAIAAVATVVTTVRFVAVALPMFAPRLFLVPGVLVCALLWGQTAAAGMRAAEWLGSGILGRAKFVWFICAVVCLTCFIGQQARSGALTLSWGVEAMAVFVFALWAKERVYRLTALGILGLCMGKLLLVDFWRMAARDRYITLIVLGAVLLAISYLYSRYKETIRQLL